MKHRFILLIDQLLTLVASRKGWFWDFSLRVAAFFVPGVVANVYFRRGSLKLTVNAVSGRGETFPVQRKASEMLRILENGYSPKSRLRPDECNLQCSELDPLGVLAIFHSSVSIDRNGYGVRSVQVLDCLRSVGFRPKVITRLGYPWDLHRHAELPRVKSSAYDRYVFEHTADSGRLIAGLESEYIRAYSEVISRAAASNGVSWLHAHSNYLNGLAACSAGEVLGLPVIYEMRGLWFMTRAVEQPIYRNSDHYRYCMQMELEAATRSDHVVAISNQLANWLVDRGIAPEKVTVVGNAAESVPSNLPLAHSSPSGTLRIGYAGSLVKYEGLDLLIMAVKRAREAGLNVELSLAGGGPEYRRLQKLASSEGLEGSVRLLGRLERDQVYELYRSLDLCVLPRLDTELTRIIPPLKPLEIMSRGVCLVVSDVAALQEFVQNEHTGMVFQAGSVTDLVRVLAELAEAPEKREKIRLGAYEWVKNNAVWAQNAARYAAVYEQAKINQSQA